MIVFPLLLAATVGASTPFVSSPPAITVTVDSAKHVIILTAGPISIPHMDPGMHMEHGAPDVMRFTWPVDGALRGFNVEMRDASGQPLPRELVHHLIGVNFDRRQIVYPMVERLFGWGTETEPVLLPDGVGVPLPKGDHLGVYAMWHNELPTDVSNAYLRITLNWIPRKKVQIPVMPLYVDVNNRIGGVTTFDIPPGKSTKSYEFTFPVSGRLLAVGGHLHDYGVAVRLEDAETGKVLARLKADRDKEGRVSKVGRYIWGFHENALPVEAGHRYRVVAEYDNPTRDTIQDGAMGHINGAFSPTDMAQWPALDPSDPEVQKDLAALPTSRSEMRMTGGHSHESHAAPASARVDGHDGMEKMDHSSESGCKMDMAKMNKHDCPMMKMNQQSKTDSARTP